MAFCLLIRMSHKHSEALCAYLHPNWIVNVASKDKNSFMPMRKVSLSLHQFSQNPLRINKFLWISSVPNSTQTAQV